jgi:hypothetical protein
MNVQESPPPTPKEFIDILVQKYVVEDPLNPFMSRSTEAKKQLLLQAMAEVYGKEHPICQFLQAYARIERASFPVGLDEEAAMELFNRLDDMREAWEVIEQDINETMDSIK